MRERKEERKRKRERGRERMRERERVNLISLSLNPLKRCWRERERYWVIFVPSVENGRVS